MCDRAVPQQALCDELAGLLVDGTVPRADAAPAVAWLRGFWATMARDWTGIDVYRMNKFMLLVRRMLAASFQWMRRADGDGDEGPQTWDPARTEAILSLLAAWPLALEDEALADEDAARRKEDRTRGLGTLAPPAVPVGLKLHLLDIWADEAEKAGLLDEEDAQAREILARLVAMVDVLERRTTYPAIRIRAKESLADERLTGRARSAGKQGEVVGDDGSWDGFDD
jgi:ribosomal RNA-processing protein 1